LAAKNAYAPSQISTSALVSMYV